MPIDFAADVAEIFAADDFPLQALTYTQGTTVIAVTNAWKLGQTWESDPDAPDLERTTFAIQGSQLSAIRPAPGDTITETGDTGRPWTVALDAPHDLGAFEELFVLPCQRRLQRGRAS